MATKENSTRIAALFGLGQQPPEAVVALQKEVLGAYQKANDAWLVRVKSEVDFWSELSAKLAATRSVPEAIEACTQSVSQRMQMSADDGRRLLDDCQEVTQKITQSLTVRSPRNRT
jgi:hypothetical protein